MAQCGAKEWQCIARSVKTFTRPPMQFLNFDSISHWLMAVYRTHCIGLTSKKFARYSKIEFMLVLIMETRFSHRPLASHRPHNSTRMMIVFLGHECMLPILWYLSRSFSLPSHCSLARCPPLPRPSWIPSSQSCLVFAGVWVHGWHATCQ